MRVAIAYPPLPDARGVPCLAQNRQFQWFREPSCFYPMVPASAATLAARAGHEVAWLDGIAAGWSHASFVRRLDAFRPDLVLLETKTPVVRRHWAIAAEWKRAWPGMRIALAGDHATALPEESLARAPIDYVLTGGDYDILFARLADRLEDGGPLPEGIRRRADPDGRIASTGPFRLDEDLDRLPWIDRDLTQWRLYSRNNGNYRRLPGTYILSGRDCWHGACTFCSWTTLYPRYRARSPENVLGEIEDVVRRYGIRDVMDDTGTFPAGEWLASFCEGAIKRNLPRRVRLACNFRFGAADLATYRLMARAGFRFVLFGLESASQATLDRIRKGTTVERIVESSREAAQAGLLPHVTIMVGYPWETADDARRTVELGRTILEKGWAHTLQATLVVPYPGTPLHAEAKRNGWLLTEDWDRYDMREPVLRVPMPIEELHACIRGLYR
ncbi:MAG: radical SAM protein, partial [Planctomycetes bacterium]|nr:radical SAM protein [Planctomycetota bacterium]